MKIISYGKLLFIGNVNILILAMLWTIYLSNINNIIIRCVCFGVGFGLTSLISIIPILYYIKKIEDKEGYYLRF